MGILPDQWLRKAPWLVFSSTISIHSTGDVYTEARINEQAYSVLKNHGVETELLPVPGAQHMLGVTRTQHDDLF